MEFKKKRVAVFINGWSTDYIEDVLEGIRKNAAIEGVDIFVFLTYILWDEPTEQSECQLNIFHLPNPNDFDGAIVLTNTFNAPEELERIKNLFLKNGVPMVSTEVKVPGMALVGTDNVSGMEQLANHLIKEHNVKDVIYVSGIAGNVECSIRKNTLVRVLAENNLKLREDIRGDYSYANAIRALRKWLGEGNKLPDAFVCANDQMALGIMTVLNEHGIEVPGDVIVTGFDKMKEGRTIYPILASVSRNCDKLGEYAYEELKRQVVHRDHSYESIYDTTFVPSESCGCEANSEDTLMRQNRLRNLRIEFSFQNLQDLTLQQLRFELSTVETKEEFNVVAAEILGHQEILGSDFCICSNPWIFDETFEEPTRDRGYHKFMDVLYERKNGKSLPIRSFKTEEMYPDYRQEFGKSNTYIFMPLNHKNMVIGYLGIKNYVKCIYGTNLRKIQADLNPTFVFIKQYIHAQQANRKLKDIYMTDFLTGMYNRTGCETELFNYCNEAKLRNETTVLMFADIDCMKQINDRYGHLNGDLAIKAAAEAMKRAMPGQWKFGRYGGDEFVAVGRCENEDTVEDIRKKVSASVKEIIEGMKLSFTLSVSIGYYIVRPDDNHTIEEYINHADESMYEEKQIAHKRLLDEEQE